MKKKFVVLLVVFVLTIFSSIFASDYEMKLKNPGESDLRAAAVLRVWQETELITPNCFIDSRGFSLRGIYEIFPGLTITLTQAELYAYVEIYADYYVTRTLREIWVSGNMDDDDLGDNVYTYIEIISSNYFFDNHSYILNTNLNTLF